MPGQNIVEIELETAPGELTPANNRVVVAAEGVRENLRVLLVSGEPHAGERVWRNLLKSDAAVDLVHFTILRPPQKQDGTPIHQLSLIAFPTRELFSEKIKDFDLIIFDRYQHRDILQLLYYENIARYVEQGGALLVAAGDDYAGQMSLSRTPLSVVLPATPTGPRARAALQGAALRRRRQASRHARPARHRRREPGKEPTWGRWFRQVDVGAEPRPHRHERRRGPPAAGARPQGARAAWRCCSPITPGCGRAATTAAGRTPTCCAASSHWLMKEPDLEEERLIASAKGLKLTIERRSMEDDVPPVQVSAPGGENSEVTLEKAGPGAVALHRRRQGARPLQAADAGRRPATLHAVAHAGIEDAREMSEVTATDEKLKPLVEATGGGIFWTRGGGLLSSVSASSVDAAAHLHAGQRPRAGRLRLAGPQGPRGLRHPRRQADPDVHGLPGAGRAAGAAGPDLVARGAVGVIPVLVSRDPTRQTCSGVTRQWIGGLR